MCSTFFLSGFLSLIYIVCCCVNWFPWVQCDFDGWMFLWLMNLRLPLMLLLPIYHVVSKQVYIVFITHLYIKPWLFNCIFFDILLVTIIYLVWYICICIFSFFNIYLFFELLILITVTLYFILYVKYIYILVHMT